MSSEFQLLRLTLASHPNADPDTIGLTASDLLACDQLHCVIALSAGCSLDMHPGGKNWVEENGGLPTYICETARAILRDGKMSVSHAIATAVSRIKVLAAKGNKKAVTAAAEWEKLKAKADK